MQIGDEADPESRKGAGQARHVHRFACELQVMTFVDVPVGKRTGGRSDPSGCGAFQQIAPADAARFR